MKTTIMEGTSIVPLMATPYGKFRQEFKETVNSKIFTSNLVKIFTLQTGGGKSHFQDTEMPIILKEAFPELKYIFRLSPTLEVARDGTFDNVKELNKNSGYIFKRSIDPSNDFLELVDDCDDVVACVSITHNYFIHNVERLIKYAPASVMCVEEAHQFIGCADQGRVPYITVSGYGAEYTAETWQRLERWQRINPRILGFTATPTVHHLDSDNSLSSKFDTRGELATLDEILPFQSWIGKVVKYPLERYQGARDINNHVQNSIDILFSKEEQLEKLKQEDPNINSKLAGYFVCGDTRGVWGCPIEANNSFPVGVREIIADYLLSLGFNPHDKMIATMREGNNSPTGGCIIWDLEGNKEKVDDSKTLFKRLEDPNDPVRFLLVVSRGRSGINVHNLAINVVCRIRDPKEIRTHIPVQIFGRMVRTNTGTGDLIRTKYRNDLNNYLENYPKDYGVDLNVVIETIKTANVFDVWYPENPKAKRTWNDSMKEFKKNYVNLGTSGIEWMYSFAGLNKPDICVEHLVQTEYNTFCPHCGKDINAKIFEDGSITLDRFFNL